MSRERRKDNRVDVNWKVRIGKRGSGVANGKAQNASISGIYVETTLTLQAGDHAMLEVRVDTAEDSRPILCEALVARKDEMPQRQTQGYGMQFTRIDDEALQRILILVAELWELQQAQKS